LKLDAFELISIHFIDVHAHLYGSQKILLLETVRTVQSIKTNPWFRFSLWALFALQ